MRLGPVMRFVGIVHAGLGVGMILPLAVATQTEGTATAPFAVGFLAALGVSGVAFAAGQGFRQRAVVRSGLRELFLSLLIFWGIVPFVAAVPFIAGGMTVMQGWFEAVSALTTTGAWLTETGARATPSGVIYRATLQWGGGFVSIATAASAFVRPEFIGIAPLVPPFSRGESGSFLRAFDRASWTFLPVYSGLTVAGAVALYVAGVAPVESIAMAMSFLATGGFLPSPAGFSAYPPGVIPIAAFLMFLGAINFILIAGFVLGRSGRVRLAGDRETVAFILLIAPVAILYWLSVGAGDWDRIPAQTFNAVSVLSTNGVILGEAPALTPVLVTAIIGGAAVSTAGGIKLLRWLITISRTTEELWRLCHPGAVRGARPHANEIGIWIHTLAFTLLLAVIVLTVAWFGYSIDSGVSTAVAVVANAGPLVSLSQQVGADFLTFEPALRVMLGIAMIAGRLELIILLVMLNRRFWSG